MAVSNVYKRRRTVKELDAMESRLLLDVEEAAAMLGIRRSLLYSLLSRGELQGVKVGRRRLIARRELEIFVERLRADQAQGA